MILAVITAILIDTGYAHTGMPKDIDTAKIFIRSFRARAARLVGTFVLAAGIMIFFWSRIGSINSEIIRASEQRGSAVRGLDTIATLYDQRKDAEVLYERLLELLQDEFAVVVNVPKRLVSLAAAHHVRAQVKVDKKSSIAEGLGRIDLEIRADGSMQSLSDYMNAIERERMYVGVRAFSIGLLGPNEFQLRMNLGVFIDNRPSK